MNCDAVVVGRVVFDVSNDCSASIFRVSNLPSVTVPSQKCFTSQSTRVFIRNVAMPDGCCRRSTIVRAQLDVRSVKCSPVILELDGSQACVKLVKTA